MASKKTAKKATKAVKVLTFNKANAKAFADNIFSDQGGRVTFLKLCDGDLSNGKDGGRTLHCALGEAYFTFVHPNVKRFVDGIEKKFSSEVTYTFEGVGVAAEGNYQPKYFLDKHGVTHAATLAVTDALVDVATLKSNTPAAKKKLAKALLDTMHSNDNACGVGDNGDDHLARAHDVAQVWREKVVPLLK
jgi:hypothetical protein